jgi:hypothetical protein
VMSCDVRVIQVVQIMIFLQVTSIYHRLDQVRSVNVRLGQVNAG